MSRVKDRYLLLRTVPECEDLDGHTAIVTSSRGGWPVPLFADCRETPAPCAPVFTGHKLRRCFSPPLSGLAGFDVPARQRNVLAQRSPSPEEQRASVRSYCNVPPIVLVRAPLSVSQAPLRGDSLVFVCYISSSTQRRVGGNGGTDRGVCATAAGLRRSDPVALRADPV